jgi:ribonuclease T2
VWYYAHVFGRTQDGFYKPIDQTTKSNCNATAGVWYYERTKGSEA